MTIDKSSRGLLAVIFLCALLVCLALFLFVRIPWIVWPLVCGIVWFCVWQVFFFHVPRRNTTALDGEVCAVSDGKVIICQKEYESEVLQRECLKVSVYMNFFDVHANFWPATGEVTHYEYHPGLHVYAHKPKASLENEHTCVVVRCGESEILFKQIAGGFARRIVCNAVEGGKVRAGTQCGIIKFGSRIDYFLPLDSKVKVSLGQMVRACETVIAELPGARIC